MNTSMQAAEASSQLMQARVFSWQSGSETLFDAVVLYNGKTVHRVEEVATEVQARQDILEWAQRHGKAIQWEGGNICRPEMFSSGAAPGEVEDQGTGNIKADEAVEQPQHSASRESSTALERPALSLAEERDLALNERRIREGLEAADDARKALSEIAERKLYRAQYGTFEEYCEKRWNISARRGYQFVTWSAVEKDLIAGPGPAPAVLPTTESQARPLAPLPAEQRREAWQEAVKNAPEGKQPTAKEVQRAVRKVKGEPPAMASTGGELKLEAETAEAAPAAGKWPFGAEVTREQVLLAASLAVVRIRALQDLVGGDYICKGICQQAAGGIEQIEGRVKGFGAAEEEPHAKGAKGTKGKDRVDRIHDGLNAGFVIVREREAGSVWRTANGAGGWTSELRKAQVYAKVSDATKFAKSYDKVATLKSQLSENAYHPPQSKAWPKANAHGVYPENHAEKKRFSHGKISVEILMLQVGPAKWAYAYRYELKGSGVGCGSGSCAPSDRELLPTRADAALKALDVIAGFARGTGRGVHKASGDRLMEWVTEHRKEARKAKLL